MNFIVPIALNEIFAKVFGSRPKFRKGDCVQCITGDDRARMEIQWVRVLKNSVIMYSCKWYDTRANSIRTNIFREESLMRIEHNLQPGSR